MNRRSFSLAGLGIAVGMACREARADEYPTRPIRLVVGYPPGGANDIMARLLAARLGDVLGVQVVVENKAGANGVIGSESVANAPADGYTLLAAGMTPIVLNRFTYRKLPFDPTADFAGIGLVGSSPIILAVRPGLNLVSLSDLLVLAKSKPGVLNFATVGSGGSTRIVFELLRQTTGVDIRWIPYKGAAPAINDLLGGTVDGMAIDFPALYPYVKDGRLSALAITSETRSPLLPELKTAAEQGLPELTCGNWYALSAPARTPRPIVDKLHAALARLSQSAEFRQQLLAQGSEPKFSASTQAFDDFVKAEVDRWGRVIRAANIEAE